LSAKEDRDIKIFKKTTADTDTEELLREAAFINRQRANGNIPKAKKVGELLADPDLRGCFKRAVAELGIDDSVLTQNVLIQAYLLRYFVTQTVLHLKLSVRLLSACAVNAMYDKLIETSPQLYDAVCEGSAFTLYNLCLREDEPARCAGEHFATLCEKEDNELLIALGEKLYCEYFDAVVDVIEDFDFLSD